MSFRYIAPAVISLLISGSWMMSNEPVKAQTSCRPLKVIGGKEGQTQVRKRVSPPGTGVTRNNWNSDFEVPGGVKFRRFVATILPGDSATYDIAVYLKYSNKTSDEIYNNTSVRLTKGQSLRVSGSPRTGNQPYQVNVKVGGLTKVGTDYAVTVAGCL